MAETKKLDYKSARIGLTVSKGALSKAEKEFEINCKDIQKNYQFFFLGFKLMLPATNILVEMLQPAS